MKTALKSLLLLAAIAYLIFAVVRISRPTEDAVCTGVDYIMEDTLETQFITINDVQDILATHKFSPKGMKMGDIDLHKIEKELSASPYIDTVSCYSTANGKLCIRVTPMHPVLHVMSDNGQEYYLDRSGKTMAIGNLNADLCIATGNISKKFAAKNLAKLGSTILNDEFWNLQAQQIVVDNKGKITIIPRVGDFTIKLGDTSNLEDKLELMRLFYKQGPPAAGWNRYTEVSVEYKGQVVCKKRFNAPVYQPAPQPATPQPTETPEGQAATAQPAATASTPEATPATTTTTTPAAKPAAKDNKQQQ